MKGLEELLCEDDAEFAERVSLNMLYVVMTNVGVVYGVDTMGVVL